MTFASFRHFNPTWNMKVYWYDAVGKRQWDTGNALDAQDYTGEDYSGGLSGLDVERVEWKSPIEGLSAPHAAGFFKFDYLAKHGGWYSDTDILWFNTIEWLHQRVKDLDVVGFETFDIVGDGLWAGSPNELWTGLYGAVVANYRANWYQSAGPDAIAQYAINQQRADWKVARNALRTKHPTLKIDILPNTWVYPWTAEQVDKIFNKVTQAPDNCIGIHYFGGHPQTIEWTNKLNEKTYKEFKNTYTKYAKCSLPSA